MADYKRPGVYIQESLTPLTQASSAPGQATAVFPGAHQQGPTTPTLISSWSQFVQIYGGFGATTDYLPYAVYQYFNNGGRSCWVIRAVASDAVAATANLDDTAGSPDHILSVTAKSAGAWGNKLSVLVTPGGSGTDHFTLVVLLNGSVVERFLDISPNPVDARYAVNIVNSPTGGSAYVKLAYVFAGTYSSSTNALAAVSTPKSLATGADGAATPDLVAAAEELSSVSGSFDLNLPGVTDTTTLNAVIAWAASVGNVFVVVDTPQQAVGASSATATTNLTTYMTGGSAVSASSYSAVYGPWLQIQDPASSSSTAMRLVPPGGAVLGQYASTDITRGPQKPAAGIGTTLRGVLNTEVTFTSGDQDTLATNNVNLIKAVPGYGFCIMGARTTQPGLPSQYVSVRRTLIVIEQALIRLTRFAVFEPNGPLLWNQITSVVTQYLTGLMQQGVLQGSVPDAAFFVECDATNNTPAAVSAGYAYVDVGVALQSPAEFIVIRIGQYEGGSSATVTS
jgi:hypothetical protein